ncbi:hypothetical protein GALMADRAFT_1311757 [Galerina marginata CBS 339.88]|uniref:Uncharacterized protein n=1 Tax=Galerina marginata (strain CBS 339.88) TaxID=685588 RepID=A0A067TEG9_GALM3|nr:hypothetical protein GALMADRAFT_1311757 [Galerina marginata CBS 339.88]
MTNMSSDHEHDGNKYFLKREFRGMQGPCFQQGDFTQSNMFFVERTADNTSVQTFKPNPISKRSKMKMRE